MEVRMGDTGLTAAESTENAARRLSAVVVRVSGYSEWIAISRTPAVVGESVILEINEGDRPEELELCVIESRPFLVDGDRRHWLRLLATDLPPALFEQHIRRG